jgi:hypothetical protein
LKLGLNQLSVAIDMLKNKLEKWKDWKKTFINSYRCRMLVSSRKSHFNKR